MLVRRVEFDNDGDVSAVVLEVQARAEMCYITHDLPPERLVYPIQLSYTAEDAAELFHEAGKVPGNNVDSKAASSVFHSLLPVVDRFIEYED